MTIGEKIRESRKNSKKTSEQLANDVGLSSAAIWKVETDQLKGGPSPDLVIRIADALGDNSILRHYLQENPVMQAIIPRIFPELNNIRREPAIIFSRFADEAGEAVEAARILAQIFSNAMPERTPGYEKTLKANLEQVIDVQRCAEELFLGLLATRIITEDGWREIRERQQRKCEERGHHVPESDEAA